MLTFCLLFLFQQNGDTPLHIAARLEYEGVVEVLLQHNVNPDIKNEVHFVMEY